MKAKLKHGALAECGEHGRKRTYASAGARPKAKCPVCQMVWLADRLETSLYESDMRDLLKFANIRKELEFDDSDHTDS